MRIKAYHQRIAYFGLGVLLTSLAFQNCSKGGFTTAENAADLSSNGVLPPGPTTTTIPVQPATDNSVVSAKTAGIFDPNCMANNTVDACIFWKNPVAQQNANFPDPGLRFGLNLSATQTFGVQLNNLKSPSFLESDLLYVFASVNSIAQSTTQARAKPRLQLTNGTYKGAYQNDGPAASGVKSTAQLMAYFWLDHMRTEFTRRVGSAVYPRQVLTYVDAYSQDPTPAIQDLLLENAFFTFEPNNPDNRYIFMGFSVFCTASGKPSDLFNANCGPTVSFGAEMALSAEIYVHEMGHGNFMSRVGVTAIVADTLLKCPTDQGCFGAINEGQADFQAAMLFPEKTALGESIFNDNINGFQPFRSVASVANQNLKVADFFALNQGEIHDMGGAYAAILWAAYNDARIERRKFEQAFFLHMQMLTASANFAASRNALRVQYSAVGGSAAGLTAIDDAFAAKNVAP